MSTAHINLNGKPLTTELASLIVLMARQLDEITIVDERPIGAPVDPEPYRCPVTTTTGFRCTWPIHPGPHSWQTTMDTAHPWAADSVLVDELGQCTEVDAGERCQSHDGHPGIHLFGEGLRPANSSVPASAKLPPDLCEPHAAPKPCPACEPAREQCRWRNPVNGSPCVLDRHNPGMVEHVWLAPRGLR